MKIFVLILLITAQENSVTTAEFNSKATCEAAGNVALIKLAGAFHRGKFICVEK